MLSRYSVTYSKDMYLGVLEKIEAAEDMEAQERQESERNVDG